MEIVKLIKKQEDGSYEATLALTQEQTEFLINIALGVLVQSGLATVVEQEVDADTPLEPTAPKVMN